MGLLSLTFHSFVPLLQNFVVYVREHVSAAKPANAHGPSSYTPEGQLPTSR